MDFSFSVLRNLWCGLLSAPLILSGQVAEKSDPAKTTVSESAKPQAVESPDTNRFAQEDTDTVPGNSKADPFADIDVPGNAKRIALERGNEQRTALVVRVEVWEIGTKELAGILDGIQDTAALETWRRDLLNDPASVLIQAPAIAIDEKSRAIASSVQERIYPTEYEPPELPPAAMDPKTAKPGNSAWERWLEAAGKYAVPTAFNTRNTGETLEAAAHPVANDAMAWDLSISHEIAKFDGNTSYGAKDLLVEMPQFTRFRSGGIVRLQLSKWRILSALEAPRGMDHKPTGKSWLTLVRVEPVR